MSFLIQLYTSANNNTITFNQVQFQQCGEDILYKGKPIQAKLVFNKTGTALEFTGIPPVSTIDYLRLDHFYHFYRKRDYIPHPRKKPQYYDLAIDIYFSPMLYSELRDCLEEILKQKEKALVTTDGGGYNVELDGLQCRINLFLADDESGHIIEFSHMDREYTLYNEIIQLCLTEMGDEMY
jgi:hypothetical protein